MFTKDALIIFVRNPELGKVKSRLASTIGSENALAVYKILLEKTRSIAEDIVVDKFVFYSNYTDSSDAWCDKTFYKQVQKGNDLGEKMHHAIEFVMSKGYEKVILIGSDVYSITSDILAKAFNSLQTKEVVIGPAEDGGYYLIGMGKMVPFIFQNKQWSSDSVFQDTLQDLINIPYALLPVLNDIDYEEDLPEIPEFNMFRSKKTIQ